jgi:phosphoglycolate phosphatase-like HAD superfamily hydrolase
MHGCDFNPECTYVIGDTSHDVACARAFGARAVAVATGNSPVESLAQHSPDLLFEDLSDVEAVLRAMGVS